MRQPALERGFCGYNARVASVASTAVDRRSPWVILGPGLAAAVVVVLIAVLTNGSDHSASNLASPAEAAATAQAFGQAIQNHDFNTVCDDLFTAAARDAEGGTACAATLGSNGAMLASPRIELRSVAVSRTTASATISVHQRGQPTMTEVLQLAPERGHLRVAGVQSPGD